MALGALGTECGAGSLELPGIVERKSLELAAPRAEQIVEIPHRAGKPVATGEVVVRLDAEAGRLELEAAEARVAVSGFAGSFPDRLVDLAREPEFTSLYALTEGDHLVYRARVVLEEAPPDLRPDFPATVRLPLGRRRRAGSGQTKPKAHRGEPPGRPSR